MFQPVGGPDLTILTYISIIYSCLLTSYFALLFPRGPNNRSYGKSKLHFRKVSFSFLDNSHHRFTEIRSGPDHLPPIVPANRRCRSPKSQAATITHPNCSRPLTSVCLATTGGAHVQGNDSHLGWCCNAASFTGWSARFREWPGLCQRYASATWRQRRRSGPIYGDTVS